MLRALMIRMRTMTLMPMVLMVLIVHMRFLVSHPPHDTDNGLDDDEDLDDDDDDYGNRLRPAFFEQDGPNAREG